jgi:uncharacterized protein YndB with AHSA1/START domain
MHDEIAEVALAPIVQSVSVPLAPADAFHLFAVTPAEWWPLDTHSVFGDEAVACYVEGRVGGRFYEVHRNGSESEWGRVLRWDPPARVAFSFYPGRGPDMATEVEVTFAPQPGGTLVTLTHSGWDQSPPEMQARRKGYVTGWAHVMGKYTARAARY